MAHDSRSAEAQAYRRWYKTYRWQQHRKRQLDANPLCVMCEQEGRVTVATVADHIKPHKGNYELFWNPDNLQSLCKPHHDSTKQSEERTGYRKGSSVTGKPIDPWHPWNRPVQG